MVSLIVGTLHIRFWTPCSFHSQVHLSTQVPQEGEEEKPGPRVALRVGGQGLLSFGV